MDDEWSPQLLVNQARILQQDDTVKSTHLVNRLGDAGVLLFDNF